ncbi:CvpA family protein [Vogesella sp. LIG4]|uniref:CvpA family protein n=1 Tax=Vogesella sp. LIG4 TaxID=1192162 RepID=UPI00081FD0B9|nr:CvpA family protein [Vogesella sp. LIG4]SCK27054.1 membrane protein required for colicin V production [Vogesella sp. LIG4]
MTWLDYLILALIIGSIAISLFRGLAVELLSLGSWLLALWSARTFAPMLSEFVPLPGEGIKLVVAFLVLLLLTWFCSSLLGASLTVLMESVGLGGVNRFFGGVFGLLRGLLLATVVVMVGGLSDLPKTRDWQNALFAQPFEALALASRPWLPDALAHKMKFS